MASPLNTRSGKSSYLVLRSMSANSELSGTPPGGSLEALDQQNNGLEAPRSRWIEKNNGLEAPRSRWNEKNSGLEDPCQGHGTLQPESSRYPGPHQNTIFYMIPVLRIGIREQ